MKKWVSYSTNFFNPLFFTFVKIRTHNNNNPYYSYCGTDGVSFNFKLNKETGKNRKYALFICIQWNVLVARGNYLVRHRSYFINNSKVILIDD